MMIKTMLCGNNDTDDNYNIDYYGDVKCIFRNDLYKQVYTAFDTKPMLQSVSLILFY